jgi:hypothetical protein
MVAQNEFFSTFQNPKQKNCNSNFILSQMISFKLNRLFHRICWNFLQGTNFQRKMRLFLSQRKYFFMSLNFCINR